MKSCSLCIPCIISQVLNTARKISDDDWVHKKLLNKTMSKLIEADFDLSPAEISFECISEAYKTLGVKDPYADEKKEFNEKLLSKYDEFEERVKTSKDPFKTALRLSLTGNLIDFGVNKEVTLDNIFDQIDNYTFGVDHSEQLRDALKGAENVLYILDNAGEIVLDKLLISQFPEDVNVTCVVRKSPIINDVTAEDFEAVSLSETCTCIDPGIDSLGIPLRQCSEDFKEIFADADLVISKGQANFETLDESSRDVFFLFVAKCCWIASAAEVNESQMVVLKKKKE